MDGDLVKITLLDQTGQMRPALWIDLDARKIVKADDWEFYPSEQEKMRVELMRSKGIDP
jgi:hypothetical protein